MRREGPVLIVTARPEVATRLLGVLDGHASRVVQAPEADTILVTAVLGGMVVDVASDPAASRRLVRAYLEHQPMGRVAVLSHLDDITTLTAFACADGRLDLFFEPWDVPAMLGFLGLSALVRA